MNESSNKRAVIVGLFVILGIGILIAGILTVGNIRGTFTSKIEVISVFEDVNGLQKGNNVWFSGVKIGTVKTVEIFRKSSVTVVLQIDENAQQFIRRDAKVKISTDGFIGNKIVMIYGGTQEATPVQENDTLNVEKALSAEDIMTTFQENNKNVLAITNNFKTISGRLAKGEGSLGKMLNDETVYNQIVGMTASLQNASAKAQRVTSALADFTGRLNKKGTLVNDLTSDTVVFNSIKASVGQLQRTADSAAALTSNLKHASENPKSPLGVMLHDEQTAVHLKKTMKNLDSSSAKLDEDLKALQSNFLLRGYFKKQAKKKANP